MWWLKIDIDLFWEYLWTRPTMWLSSDSSELLKISFAILNSKLINWYYSQQYSIAGMTWFKIRYWNIKETPFPNIWLENQKSLIIFVDQILEITKKEDYLEREDLQKQVKVLESRIDDMVYKLYELTPEEIELVKDSLK